MACSRCAAHARFALRTAFRPSELVHRRNALAPRLPSLATAPIQIHHLQGRRLQSTQTGGAQAKQPAPSKDNGNSVENPQEPKEPQEPQEPQEFEGVPANGFGGAGLMGSYAIYGGTLQIYKGLSTAASYSISPVARSRGEIETMPDGEEVGVSEGPWHKILDLPPTFSTWSQVTMLRMYLLVARARALDPEAYENFYQQLLNHFFFDSERLMDVNHNMSSKAHRQRFLKDLFVQWRGLVAAYDEGLVRGDAVLASAVWRNLYKARAEGVDFRNVAAVVGWIRATLNDLERRSDGDFVVGKELFRKSLQGQFAVVDALIEKGE